MAILKKKIINVNNEMLRVKVDAASTHSSCERHRDVASTWQTHNLLRVNKLRARSCEWTPVVARGLQQVKTHNLLRVNKLRRSSCEWSPVVASGSQQVKPKTLVRNITDVANTNKNPAILKKQTLKHTPTIKMLRLTHNWWNSDLRIKGRLDQKFSILKQIR